MIILQICYFWYAGMLWLSYGYAFFCQVKEAGALSARLDGEAGAQHERVAALEEEVHPTPYTLHPTLYTLPAGTPYTLHPTPSLLRRRARSTSASPPSRRRFYYEFYYANASY